MATVPSLVLRPRPAPARRPWAGGQLGDGIGELWLAGPESIVDTPERAITLDELAEDLGETLVGRRGMRRLGRRFPLLVKLIDAGDWLSLQVHPSDELARRRHGPSAVGKAEAWVVLASVPGAVLITGPRPGLCAAEMREHIANGTLGRGECLDRPAMPGDVLYLPSGTVHAIGAGVLVYEIEQPSDLTYRISDWGRPAVPGRRLHRDEALEAARPEQCALLRGQAWQLDAEGLAAPEFALEILGPGPTQWRDPRGETPEVVSVAGGAAMLVGDDWAEPLGPGEAIVVAAASHGYRIEAEPGTRVLVGSLPA